MKRICYALILLALSAPVSRSAVAQSARSTKANRSPVAADVVRVLSEDTRASIALPATDPDGDGITVEVVTAPRNGTVTVTGSTVTYVPRKDFSGADRFEYRVGDGTSFSGAATVRLSVTPVNDPPTVTRQPGEVRIRERESYAFRFGAVDAEGSTVAWRLVEGPGGAAIDAGTGVLRWTPDLEQAGTYSLKVGASDGNRESLATVTLTVLDTEVHSGTFAAIHLTSPIISPATGSALVTYDDVAQTLVIDATFSGLSSDRAAAAAYLGPFGEDRNKLVDLVLQDDASNPGAVNGRILFPGAFNPSATFQLGLLPFLFPDGSVTAEMVVDSLRSGKVYIVVTSTDHPEGEIRAHLRSDAANSAPDAAVLDAPAAVTIEGDPQATGMEVTWSAAVDPDGDPTRQVFGLWTDASLEDMHLFVVDDGSHAVSFTVDGLAGLFADLTGGSTGSTTVYAAVLTTDGAHYTVSNTVSMSIVRGQVTATDDGGVVPDVFMLRGNFPNPFNPTTTIQFDLPAPAEVEVYVTDLLGRVAISVPSQPMSAGLRRQIPIDASALASGIYIYRVTARTAETTHVATGTMTLLK
jgi:hypothetical protein